MTSGQFVVSLLVPPCAIEHTDFSPGVSSSLSSRSFMALPMLAMLMLSGDALLFRMSRPLLRLCERLPGRTLFLRSGIPGAWLRCAAGLLCDKDSERSGELRLDTSPCSAREEVEAACRSMLRSASAAAGAAGAGISACLAMGQAKAHTSEIAGWLDLDLEAEAAVHCWRRCTLTARLLG